MFTFHRYAVSSESEPLIYFSEWAAEILNVNLSNPALSVEESLPETYPVANIPKGNFHKQIRL